MSGMDGATIFFYEGETKTSWDAGQDKSKSVQCRQGWDGAKQSEVWNFIRQKIEEADFPMAFLWYSNICLVLL